MSNLVTQATAKIGGFFLVDPENWLFSEHKTVLRACRRSNEYRIANNNSLDGAEYEIEEFVRQWVLRQLIDIYHYPIELINIEEPVQVGSTQCRVDISVKNTVNRPIIYIETKRREISSTEFRKAEKQIESYLSASHTALIAMITDGNNTRCISKKVNPNNFEYVPDILTWSGDSFQNVSTEYFVTAESQQVDKSTLDEGQAEKSFLPLTIEPNYNNLREYLVNGMWKEADCETGRIMLEVAGREKDLDNESLKKFPIGVLRNLDQLWVEHSGGKFGFSVQKSLYEKMGEGFIRFTDFAFQVGWSKGFGYGEKLGLDNDKTGVSTVHLNYNLIYPPTYIPSGIPLTQAVIQSAKSCPSGYFPSLKILARYTPNRRSWFYVLVIGKGAGGNFFYNTQSGIYYETTCLKQIFDRLIGSNT